MCILPSFISCGISAEWTVDNGMLSYGIVTSVVRIPAAYVDIQLPCS